MANFARFVIISENIAPAKFTKYRKEGGVYMFLESNISFVRVFFETAVLLQVSGLETFRVCSVETGRLLLEFPVREIKKNQRDFMKFIKQVGVG